MGWGACEVLPLRKRWGGKSFSHAEGGGTKGFHPLKGGGGHDKFYPVLSGVAIFPFCRPPPHN